MDKWTTALVDRMKSGDSVSRLMAARIEFMGECRRLYEKHPDKIEQLLRHIQKAYGAGMTRGSAFELLTS